MCNGIDHTSENCKYKNVVCRYCNEDGHIERLCRKKNDQKESCAYVKTATVDGEPLYTASVRVDDSEIPMIVDTGSDISCIPVALWKEIGSPMCSPSDKKLLSLNDTEIQTKGMYTASMEYNGKIEQGTIYVTRTESALLGKDMLRKLKVVKVTPDQGHMSRQGGEVARSGSDRRQDAAKTAYVKAGKTVKAKGSTVMPVNGERVEGSGTTTRRLCQVNYERNPLKGYPNVPGTQALCHDEWPSKTEMKSVVEGGKSVRTGKHSLRRDRFERTSQSNAMFTNAGDSERMKSNTVRLKVVKSSLKARDEWKVKDCHEDQCVRKSRIRQSSGAESEGRKVAE